MGVNTHLEDKKRNDYSASADLLPDILNRISKTSEGLTHIGHQTEKEFITLGQSLMEGDAVGKSIASKAIEIVSVTGGDAGKNTFSFMKEQVNQTLSRFRGDKEKIHHQFVSIKEILGHLYQLRSKNDDIERLGRYLRVVALNIFIETSRSHILSDSFSIIAHEIKNLSDTIVDLAKTIQTTVDDSQHRFSTLYDGTRQGIAELDQLTANADTTLKEAVLMTDGWITLAESAASHAVSMGESLAGHVGKIVMALQFHDAMRQRIDHIVTGLSDINDLLMNQSNKKEEIEAETDLEALSIAHAMTDLLSDHMAHMIVEIEEVHSQCAQAFDAISLGIETIGKEVGSLVGGAAEGKRQTGGDDASRYLLSSLQSFGFLRSRGAKLIDEMNQIFSMSVKTTSTQMELIGKIHDISMDAHIKGINAIIAATHLGQEGRALAVLAEEMKHLSDLAELFVKELETIIGQVASSMEGSRIEGDTADDQERGQERGIDDTLTEIVTMVETMKKGAADLHKTMAAIHKIHQRVKTELQVLPSMKKELTIQKKNLNDLLTLLSPFSDSRGKEKLAGSEMMARYTMEKERQIHRISVSETHETAEQNSPDLSSELGDNVELF